MASSTLLKRVFIFSDLHLTRLDSELGKVFLASLDGLNGSGDAVIFAGDIFEVMVGTSVFFSENYAPFFSKVESLIARGVRVDYIEGNHDFHLQGLLPKEVRIHNESVDLDVLGLGDRSLRMRIEHGDLVDREDRAYLRMRSVFRSKEVKRISQVLPGGVIERLAGLIARGSDQKVSDLPENWSESERAKLRAKYRTHAEQLHRQGVDFLVMGHCHDLDEWEGFYWNMGYPPVHRQFLVYETPAPGQKESLKRRNFL
jgi:UDP-2,3-diacylglucosamine hydrolase